MARIVRVSGAMAAVMAVALLQPATAVAATAPVSQTVVAAEVTHTTKSPQCTFSFRVTETITGTDVTALHLRGNRLGHERGVGLDALRGLGQLQTLGLSYNAIDLGGAAALSASQRLGRSNRPTLEMIRSEMGMAGRK